MIAEPMSEGLADFETALANVAAGVPLLVLDMYEHAYAADYGTDTEKYIEAFVQAIKWTNAERLYREAMRV